MDWHASHPLVRGGITLHQ